MTSDIPELRAAVSKSELEMLIHAFISSHLYYGNTQFSCLSCIY